MSECMYSIYTLARYLGSTHSSTYLSFMLVDNHRVHMKHFLGVLMRKTLKGTNGCGQSKIVRRASYQRVHMDASAKTRVTYR
jgi:hypothetical protein